MNVGDTEVCGSPCSKSRVIELFIHLVGWGVMCMSLKGKLNALKGSLEFCRGKDHHRARVVQNVAGAVNRTWQA